jgi:hypothetical protein
VVRVRRRYKEPLKEKCKHSVRSAFDAWAFRFGDDPFRSLRIPLRIFDSTPPHMRDGVNGASSGP